MKMVNEMQNNNFSKHKCGAKECEECLGGYPTLCQCGGLIHAEYGVTEKKDQFTPSGVIYNCDRCGTKFMRSNGSRRKSRVNNNSRNYKSYESKKFNGRF